MCSNLYLNSFFVVATQLYIRRGLSGIGAIFAIIAFILMWIASLRCAFVKFPSTSGNSGDADMQLGLWYYTFISFLVSTGGTYAFESCNVYPETVTMDASWKAARAFSVIAFICGIIMLVAACVSLCCNPAKRGYGSTYVWEAPGYLLTALCQVS